MGIPHQVLLRAAGYFQPKKVQRPGWGRWWGSAPYGDDPTDQVWIGRGIQHYRNGVLSNEVRRVLQGIVASDASSLRVGLFTAV